MEVDLPFCSKDWTKPASQDSNPLHYTCGLSSLTGCHSMESWLVDLSAKIPRLAPKPRSSKTVKVSHAHIYVTLHRRALTWAKCCFQLDFTSFYFYSTWIYFWSQLKVATLYWLPVNCEHSMSWQNIVNMFSVIVSYNSPPSLLPLCWLCFQAQATDHSIDKQIMNQNFLTAVTQLCQENALSSALEASSSRKSEGTADQITC